MIIDVYWNWFGVAMAIEQFSITCPAMTMVDHNNQADGKLREGSRFWKKKGGGKTLLICIRYRILYFLYTNKIRLDLFQEVLITIND